jgi:hypothetical protein
VRGSDLVGRRVELRVSDTPGSPVLHARVLGRIDAVRQDVHFVTRDGHASTRYWGLLIRLDAPWESSGSAFAFVTPRNPSRRAHIRRFPPVVVDVAAEPGVESAETVGWSSISVLADARLHT